MFIKFNTIISSNSHFKVSVSEAMNHVTMSEYSVINEKKIAHFIHSANFIKSNELSDVQDAFT